MSVLFVQIRIDNTYMQMASVAVNTVFVSTFLKPPSPKVKVLQGGGGALSLPRLSYKSVKIGRLEACLATKTDQQNRRLADFPSNIWKHVTLDNPFTSAASRLTEFDQRYSGQMEQLRDKLKEMLIAPTSDPIEKISFINSICRLGVSCHFEAEIDQQLNNIFQQQPNIFDNDYDYDLYTVALLFRVFRQHGFKISCDVFDKFKEDNGKFKESLSNDANGMLSLYEASHVRMHGEDTLDEAFALSMAHLKSLVDRCSPHLAKKIAKALDMPLHKGIPRLEAFYHISFYQEDHKSVNETLLLFAKLDYNRVQLVHQQELNHLISWWKNLDLASKLPHTRDRLMECYFWLVSIYFEPCYSRGRLILTKFLKLMSVIDDIYDSYANIEDLRLFTHAIQRWNISALDELPDYMKDVYSALLNTFDELYNDLTEEERSYGFFHTKDKTKEVVGAYHLEAEWYNQNYVPTFEEYLRNGMITAHCYTISALTFLGFTDAIAVKNAFEWLQNEPKLVRDAYIINRLLDDITTHEFEQKRGHVASAVECYMEQHNLSREETVGDLMVMVEDVWKSVNEECMKPTIIPIRHLLLVVNTARMATVTYKDMDGYTNPDNLKHYITNFFIDPIRV